MIVERLPFLYEVFFCLLSSRVNWRRGKNSGYRRGKGSSSSPTADMAGAGKENTAHTFYVFML